MGICASLFEDKDISSNQGGQFSSTDLSDAHINFSRRRIKNYISEGIIDGIYEPQQIELRYILENKISLQGLKRIAKLFEVEVLIDCWIDLFEWKSSRNKRTHEKAEEMFCKYVNNAEFNKILGLSVYDGSADNPRDAVHLCFEHFKHNRCVDQELYSGVSMHQCQFPSSGFDWFLHEVFVSIYMRVYINIDVTKHDPSRVVGSSAADKSGSVIADISKYISARSSEFTFNSVEAHGKASHQLLQLTQPMKELSVNDFVYHEVIGEGAYGVVVLCNKISTGKQYAMKIQENNMIVRSHKYDMNNVCAEVGILKSCNHPFISKLHFAFRTTVLSFLLLDYCPYGDMAELLRNSPDGKLSSEIVLPCIAELASAVMYLHSSGIMHKDIKPGNILICNDGHIQLTDFGCATDIRNERRSYRVHEDSSGGHSFNPLKYFRANNDVSVHPAVGGKSSSSSNVNLSSNSNSNSNPLSGPATESIYAVHQRRESGTSVSATGGEVLPSEHVKMGFLLKGNTLCGSEGYMAPEVGYIRAIGRKESYYYTQAIDWWSVGATMYRLIVGKKCVSSGVMTYLLRNYQFSSGAAGYVALLKHIQDRNSNSNTTFGCGTYNKSMNDEFVASLAGVHDLVSEKSRSRSQSLMGLINPSVAVATSDKSQSITNQHSIAHSNHPRQLEEKQLSVGSIASSSSDKANIASNSSGRSNINANSHANASTASNSNGRSNVNANSHANASTSSNSNGRSNVNANSHASVTGQLYSDYGHGLQSRVLSPIMDAGVDGCGSRSGINAIPHPNSNTPPNDLSHNSLGSRGSRQVSVARGRKSIVPMLDEKHLTVTQGIFTDAFLEEVISEPSIRLFLVQTLDVNFITRLGSGPCGNDNIRNHAVFRSINWDLLNEKKLGPVYREGIFSSGAKEGGASVKSQSMEFMVPWISGCGFWNCASENSYVVANTLTKAKRSELGAALARTRSHGLENSKEFNLDFEKFLTDAGKESWLPKWSGLLQNDAIMNQWKYESVDDLLAEVGLYDTIHRMSLECKKKSASFSRSHNSGASLSGTFSPK